MSHRPSPQAPHTPPPTVEGGLRRGLLRLISINREMAWRFRLPASSWGAQGQGLRGLPGASVFPFPRSLQQEGSPITPPTGGSSAFLDARPELAGGEFWKGRQQSARLGHDWGGHRGGGGRFVVFHAVTTSRDSHTP